MTVAHGKKKPTPLQSMTILTLESFKQNSYTQAQVEQRLKPIADMSDTGTDNKIKSKRGGVKDMAKNHVKLTTVICIDG